MGMLCYSPHLLNKHLLSTYDMPGTMPGTRNQATETQEASKQIELPQCMKIESNIRIMVA